MADLQAMPAIHDETHLDGFLARPSGSGPFPAVIVMHSALGLHHQVADTARALAALGYLAVASDMYGVAADISDAAKAGQHCEQLMRDPERLRARTVAWFDAVAALPDVDPLRIAAIGYCFGGKCVLELARSGAPVRAVSSFHGILTTHDPAPPGRIAGHVAAWCGTDDPFAPAETTSALRAELSNAGASFTVTEFGGVAHGFTDPEAERLGRPGIGYDAVADAVSWAGTLALLDRALQTHSAPQQPAAIP